MADKTTNDLTKVEQAMRKLKRKLRRADLDYNIQFAINSVQPKHVVFSAQMTPLANGLRPATFISHEGADDLVVQIKAFTDKLDWKAMELAYHKGQINAAEKTIEGHKEAIELVENADESEYDLEVNATEKPDQQS